MVFCACFNPRFHCCRSQQWRGVRDRVRAWHSAEAEAETEPDDVHGRAAGGAGARLPEDSVSGRVHEGGTGAEVSARIDLSGNDEQWRDLTVMCSRSAGRSWRKLGFRCGSATGERVYGNSLTVSSWTRLTQCPCSQRSLLSTQFLIPRLTSIPRVSVHSELIPIGALNGISPVPNAFFVVGLRSDSVKSGSECSLMKRGVWSIIITRPGSRSKGH